MTYTSSDSTETILIVGGGLGGLTLAQLLTQDSSSNVQVIVFERDADIDAREQGYFITINSMGIDVLKRIHVLHDIMYGETTVSYDQCQLRLVDKHLNSILEASAGELKIIERSAVRRTLLQNIDVRWNKQFTHYDIVDEGVMVYFSDGSSVKGTLLVGCDGARSSIRAQLVPSLQREDTGVVLVAGTIEKTSLLSKTQQLIDNSLVQVLGDHGRALFLIAVGQHWFWSLSWREAQSTDRNVSVSELLDKARSSFNHEEVARLVELSLASARLTPLRLYTLPRLRKNPFPNNARVTLLGDAAHLMTIQRGMGANTTFADALDLANTIRLGITQDSLQEYEQKMFQRGFQAVQDSFNSTRMIHLGGRQAVIRNCLLWCFHYMTAFVKMIRSILTWN